MFKSIMGFFNSSARLTNLQMFFNSAKESMDKELLTGKRSRSPMLCQSTAIDHIFLLRENWKHF